MLVGDGFEPGRAVSVAIADDHGDVSHEGGVGGSVPMLFTGRALDGLAGRNAYDVAVTGADQAGAVGDVEGLAVGVGVPVGAGSGGEADQGGSEAGGFGGRLDQVEVDVTGEASAGAFSVAILRTEAGRNPHDKDLHDLVGELSTRSDEFRTRWGAHDVRHHGTGTKRFHHPVVGEPTLAYEGLDMAAEPGLTLTIYTAEPGSLAEECLRLLASWAATQEAGTATEPFTTS